MGLLITKDDFVGKWQLALNGFDQIDSYIEQYEEPLLTSLLGKELFDLFKADLIIDSGNPDVMIPASADYLKIFNSFVEKVNNYQIASDGMKKMLLGLIYFDYVRENKYKQSMNGAVEQQTETAIPADNTFMHLRHNEAISTWQIIQVYISNNVDTYPTFSGQRKYESGMI